ncbi:MAG TPA: glycoside hydrolase domain-containing protein [Edaphobacter sp.]|uniref:glycoside hydrolase domain-containing protein n=1 Tax=Edaphobacter sp. TaxID=1934404 RepID=UPI002CC42942|nr:glycoside hydrolase domain-containing protein [Edaphobacter sp.]HUZ95688.1 glycoside hydrolase domain-containing protein [Edaphobacter sp.]
MRLLITSFVLLVFAASASAQQPSVAHRSDAARAYLGFDLNNYPGDQALPALRQHFSFAGYWLNNPPGAQQNGWQGKRDLLIRNGFGFLVLFNGRLDAEITKSRKSGTPPATLGKSDAAAALAAAQHEHFPRNTILFLDQEQGGRLLPEQADYLFAWTEAVARSGYRPGVYGSGQPVNEGHGHTITTAEDIRAHIAAQHLHEIALWVVQDACPPSNGCVLKNLPPDASGTSGAAVWQYAQSPQRRSMTAACAKTYSKDGNCRVPSAANLPVDLDTADSPDPSHGR